MWAYLHICLLFERKEKEGGKRKERKKEAMHFTVCSRERAKRLYLDNKAGSRKEKAKGAVVEPRTENREQRREREKEREKTFFLGQTKNWRRSREEEVLTFKNRSGTNNRYWATPSRVERRYLSALTWLCAPTDQVIKGTLFKGHSFTIFFWEITTQQQGRERITIKILFFVVVVAVTIIIKIFFVLTDE